MTGIIDETWYRKPDNVRTKEAAGGVVVRGAGGRAYVALVREGPGLAYVLPKGRLERGESPEQAARREIQEEAGLTDLTLVAELGARERFDFQKTHWKRTHYFLYHTRQTEGRPTDPHRDYELSWFPADDPPPLFWPEQAALIHDHLPRIQALAADGT